MSKNLIRFSQVPVGATFKYINALYVKTRVCQGGGHKYTDFNNNCVRIDNQKEFRLHGSNLVEVVENETCN